ncbi:hypothetical protein CCR75_002891 [Bremia lactucae]|uniref:Isochorismatase-like domain-containing protein n=1 Tax=Bremia lactucae TaxID=4779 RepID=A0A976FMH9_BRELC|nr:hypothetical protein CCR75_002891 [Bremia lactucae]
MLFVCDVQEKFRAVTFQMPTVISSTNTMVGFLLIFYLCKHQYILCFPYQVSAAKLLNLPIVVTTQSSSRLGTTVSEITKNLEDALQVRSFDKMKFSMLVPEVEHHIINNIPERNCVLLCGIETHVCVLQTCLDLLEKGYDVHVVSDAVSSSTSYDRSMALTRMRQSGAFITSVESSIFQLADDASNPEFRGISKLIKEHRLMEAGFKNTACI